MIGGKVDGEGLAVEGYHLIGRLDEVDAKKGGRLERDGPGHDILARGDGDSPFVVVYLSVAVGDLTEILVGGGYILAKTCKGNERKERDEREIFHETLPVLG